MSNFCAQCGAAAITDQNYCSNCGKKFPDLSDSALKGEFPVQRKVVNSKSVYPWVCLGIAAIIGVPAMQSAFGMPTQAEYVTFDFTFDHLLNGGWYVWYSGDSAILAKFTQSGGMEASTLRLILWFVSGFSISLAFPGLRALFHRFKIDGTK